MKYIIDIPDDRVCDYVGSTHLLMPYIMAGHKGHHDTGLNLTPYTEPGQKTIDLQHAHDIENVARMNYSKGAEDAWEFVRTVTDMTEAQRMQCFGGATCDLDEYYTYQEAKAKYEAWKKQKDEIRVGDEVEYTCCNNKTVRFIVTGIADGIAYGFKHICEYDDSGEYCDIDMLWKTGRHFDEVEELLKKMEENNGKMQ